jgi:uncharacterized protein YjbJ (UPF0337 family)
MSSRTDMALGKVKQTVGGLTHNKAMKRRGRYEEVKGKARHLLEQMRGSVSRRH